MRVFYWKVFTSVHGVVNVNTLGIVWHYCGGIVSIGRGGVSNWSSVISELQYQIQWL